MARKISGPHVYNANAWQQIHHLGITWIRHLWKTTIKKIFGLAHIKINWENRCIERKRRLGHHVYSVPMLGNRNNRCRYYLASVPMLGTAYTSDPSAKIWHPGCDLSANRGPFFRKNLDNRATWDGEFGTRGLLKVHRSHTYAFWLMVSKIDGVSTILERTSKTDPYRKAWVNVLSQLLPLLCERRGHVIMCL